MFFRLVLIDLILRNLRSLMVSCFIALVCCCCFSLFVFLSVLQNFLTLQRGGIYKSPLCRVIRVHFLLPKSTWKPTFKAITGIPYVTDRSSPPHLATGRFFAASLSLLEVKFSLSSARGRTHHIRHQLSKE